MRKVVIKISQGCLVIQTVFNRWVK